MKILTDSEHLAQKILTYLDEFAGLPRNETNKDTSLFLSGRLSSADAIDLFLFIEVAFGMKTEMVTVDLSQWDTVTMICDKIRTS